MANTVAVYAAGGCGTSILLQFLKRFNAANTNEAFARIKPYVIDTSDSDIKGIGDFPQENVYIFEGMDGKGKLRKDDEVPKIVAAMPKVLNNFKPQKYNIVIHSASGGERV